MASRRRDGRRHARVFSALLALYPAEFRDEYGRELTLVFLDRYRQAAGATGRALVWLGALRGLAVEAPREHLHMIRQDLRHAWRAFVARPLFALTVVLTLALGIGANTGVFQLVEAVGLRALPVRDPHELVEIRIDGGNGGFGLNPDRYGGLTQPIWHDFRRTQQALSGALAWSAGHVRLGEDDELRRANAVWVSGEFFDVLGVRPAQGRLIGAQDEAVSCPATAVVVSHRFWQQRLGGAPIGHQTRLRVDTRSLPVVGVAPAGFTGVAVGEDFDVALALCRQPQWRSEVFDVAVMGRLRPGWTIDQAAAHVRGLSPALFADNAPQGYGPNAIARFKAFRLTAVSAASGVSALRDQYDRALWLLLGITGLVLLIACANLANLLLARAAQRQREVAVRLALGASRLVLVRQLLTESMLLTLCGAMLGIVVAQGMSRAIVRSLSTQSAGPVLVLSANWRVLGFTVLVAALTCLVFGLAPALRASRAAPIDAMRGGRGLTADRGRLLTQRTMVVAQIAVSLVLLVAALLFVGSFRNLMTFDPGMRQADITVGFFGYPRLGLPRDRLSPYQRELVDDLATLPGVLGVAITTNPPLLGSTWAHGIRVDAISDSANFTWVGPAYFETMGIPLLRGRVFTLDDTASSPRVAVVNETFVQRFVADGRPLGRTLQTAPEPGYPATTYEIVGVIPATRYHDYRGDPRPMVFAPDSQFPGLGPWASMVIRSNAGTPALTEAIRARLKATRPGTFFESLPLQATIRDRLVRERLLALLSAFFGGLAALLAMIGLYGMMSFATAQRRQEIGVRVALGASRGHVVGLVMRDAARLVLIGMGLGLVAALVVTRGAAALLFEVTPHDPLTLVGAGLLLTVIAAAAAFVPARRAARLDPLTALRQD